MRTGWARLAGWTSTFLRKAPHEMADGGYTAVIDIGRTHIKLCMVDESGTIVDSQVRENWVVPAPPFPHFDVEGIWEWLLSALRTVAAKFPISGIVPTAHAAASALIAGGDLLLPILDYEFSGIEDISAEYDALARNFSETLSPGLPVGHNLGRQLFWLRCRFPDAFAKARHILTYPQYWSWRLSGVPASEVTLLGCHTDLWKPSDNTFSTFACEMGWNRLFPPLMPAWHLLGPVRPEIAATTGLRPDCPVYNGIHDSNASYLRHLVTRRGEFTVVSTGTWVICFAAGRPTNGLDETKDTLANVDVLGKPVACSRFMGGREFAEIAGPGDARIAGSQADVYALIEKEIFAVPAFSSQGGPFRRRPGRIVGPATRAPGERVSLASMYCALMIDHCLYLIDAQGDLIIEGSFLRNPVLCGLLAALRQPQSTFLSDDMTGTVTGAAMLARWPPHDVSVRLRPCTPLELPGLGRYKSSWQELCA